MVSVVIGWDIGGAHLKAARVRHGRVEAVAQAATPLWLGLDSLKIAFDALSAQLGCADRHVITMTGELCDAFPSRREGVGGLAAIAANHPPPAAPSLYAGRAGFVELGDAASHAVDIASANWHASAALLALKLPDALFIDIGSTTTDVIPIVASQVAAAGYSDAERLAAGELIYTGMTRSFVMSLASRAPFRGAWARRLVRGSANTSDYRRGVAPAVPQRCGGRGAGGCGGRRGRPRGGSGAPPAPALSRIFFAHLRPRGSLALCACGCGCVAWRSLAFAS